MATRLNLLLCPVGSLGDMHPMFAIADEARRRGHRITLLANEEFEKSAVDLDGEFVAVQDAETLRAMTDDPRSYTYATGYRRHLPVQCVEPMRRLYAALAERSGPADTVVVASNWAFGARIASEKLKIPLATVHTDPHTLRSARGIEKMPPPMIVGPWVARWCSRLQFWVADHLLIDPLCRGAVNEFRGALGLPPVSRIMHEWWNSPQLILGLFPDWWGKPQPEWPRQTRLVGFPVYDRGSSRGLSAETERFLAAGPAPIIITPGNSCLHTTEYFSAAIAACVRIDRRAIVITPRADSLPPKLPAGIHHTRYEPFRHLLPYGAAILHHAGTGTVAAAMRHGLPQLSIPTTFNQPDAAARLVKLGVGRTIGPRSFSARRIASGFLRLLESPHVAESCRTVAAKFGPANEAARRACDSIETLGGRRRAAA